jgi:hypothetical protein
MERIFKKFCNLLIQFWLDVITIPETRKIKRNNDSGIPIKSIIPCTP